ncbi:MAG: hypothetical protein ACPG4M_06585 [Alphaproteobacteria bacterium]
MSMKPIRRAVAACGKYIKNGEEKTRYQRVGTLFKDDQDGRLSLKIDAIPVGAGFEGWVNFYELDENRQKQPQQQSAPQQSNDFDGGSFDDDIPF